MTDEETIQALRSLLNKPKDDWDLEGYPPRWRPPATKEQLSQTEKELGFPLPEFLKNMYLEVSNGGVGPAYGLMNVTDEDYDPRADDTSIVAFHKLSTSDDEDDAWRWPERMLCIAVVGCGILWCLDCWKDELVYFAGDNVDPEDTDRFNAAFHRTNHTLQQAIAAWLTRKPWVDLILVD